MSEVICSILILLPYHSFINIPFVQLFTVYEEHLRQSSVVVAEEQNQLARSIKQADQSVSQILC